MHWSHSNKYNLLVDCDWRDRVIVFGEIELL